jgi:hypothetical protein
VLFIQNSEDLFSQLDKQFDRAEAFENCQGHQTCHARSIIFKPKDFKKKP